jgi:hypothetical protein
MAESRYTTNPTYKGSLLTDEFRSKISDSSWFPTHFIVSLVSRQDRRAKMVRKMAHAQLPYQLIDALTPSDDIIVKHYGQSCPLTGRWGTNGSRLGPVIACMVSHFKALRTFLESPDELAVILEDDVILRYDYKERLRQLIDKYANSPMFPNVIMIGPGLDPKNDELHATTNCTWGALGYIISRTYAQHVLATYDKPYVHLMQLTRRDGVRTILDKHGASSELITMKSGGLVCSIPLVIEQPNETSNTGNRIAFHEWMFSKFGYQNYVNDYP